MSKDFYRIIIIILAFVAAALWAGWIPLGQKSPEPAPIVAYPVDVNSSRDRHDLPPPPMPVEVDYVEPKKYKIENLPTDFSGYYSELDNEPGIIWLEESEEIQRPILFADQGTEYTANMSYDVNIGLSERLGYDNGRSIILVTISPMGMWFGPEVHYIFRETETSYEVLANHSYFYDGEDHYEVPTLAAGVTVNENVTYAALDAPGAILTRLTSQPFEQVTEYEELFAAIMTGDFRSKASLDLISESSHGPFYRLNREIISDERLQMSAYYLRQVAGYTTRYKPDYEGMFDDSSVLNVTWQDGSKNEHPYRTDGIGGCGSFGTWHLTVDPSYDILSELTLAGYNQNGKPVYEPSSPDHWLVSYYYDATGGKTYSWDPVTKKGSSLEMTREDFLNNHGVVVYIDGTGLAHVFGNMTYGPAAECAKPVIYLYPEEITDVSVVVGADVTKSEPIYRESGWQVTARPDGTLLMADGSQYDSLFWDGIGHGMYPEITHGTWVTQSEIESTLWQHLGLLGLNLKEATDFMEYWLPLMPSDPYVRLTWFGTRAMDELAPLSVTPKPDTSIRIFLDFAGSDEPYYLEPQILTSVPRDGFTLVEWGGLLVH